MFSRPCSTVVWCSFACPAAWRDSSTRAARTSRGAARSSDTTPLEAQSQRVFPCRSSRDAAAMSGLVRHQSLYAAPPSVGPLDRAWDRIPIHEGPTRGSIRPQSKTLRLQRAKAFLRRGDGTVCHAAVRLTNVLREGSGVGSEDHRHAIHARSEHRYGLPRAAAGSDRSKSVDLGLATPELCATRHLRKQQQQRLKSASPPCSTSAVQASSFSCCRSLMAFSGRTSIRRRYQRGGRPRHEPDPRPWSGTVRVSDRLRGSGLPRSLLQVLPPLSKTPPRRRSLDGCSYL